MRELQEQANRIAQVLVRDMGLVPGNRVLLRAPNSPMLAACWFAVVKAGGVAVATMPLLRAKELTTIIEKAQVTHALCDASLAEELELAAKQCPVLRETRLFNGGAAADTLEALMQRHEAAFVNVDTAADDPCLIAFTSGTTGQPKGTVHLHRDLIAACAVLAPARAEGIDRRPVHRQPAAGIHLRTRRPAAVSAGHRRGHGAARQGRRRQQLVDAIARFGATVLFTAPTSYRAMADAAQAANLSQAHGGPLRKCVSAGEALPAATRQLWKDATGLELIDGIGATEMLHIFISADEHDARPGATGKVVPGYRAEIHDDAGRPLPPGTVGRLAVKGPTGCRYLDDPRQASYVRDGWNYTGDAYLLDADGYFHFHARTDDMIVSAGYNIAAPEVEDALLAHPAVAECAVVGVARRRARPDRQGVRGAARPATRATRRWCASCRISSRRRSRRTSTRARSSSATRCHARPPASCSAFGCAIRLLEFQAAAAMAGAVGRATAGRSAARCATRSAGTGASLAVASASRVTA